MDIQKVDMFLTVNQKNLPADRMPLLRERLAAVDDSRWIALQSCEMKDTTTQQIFAIFLGQLGIDRFMLGDIGLGVLKLLTGGGCGIWTIVDWFTIQNRTREVNFNALMALL